MPAESKLAAVIETAFRAWLAKQIQLVPDRILSFDQQEGRFGYRQQFREIDAIAGDGPTPQCLFEIKTSSIPSVVSGARRQVSISRSIMQLRWEKIAACVIFVQTSHRRIQSSPSQCFASLDEFRDSGFLASLWPEIGPDVLCAALPVESVWEFAVRSGQVTDLELLQTVEDERREREQRKRLKKKLRDRGVPRERWPEALLVDESKRRPPTTTFETSPSVQGNGIGSMILAARNDSNQGRGAGNSDG
jgi:hypothetical protein